VVSLYKGEVLFIILIASIALLITGLTSELYLEDEVYHYRFAKQMYEVGRRVSYDSLYGSGMPPGYFYKTEPLWEGVPMIFSCIDQSV
jgi:4-amino-4-deoxy-L-arabinose transferase-like glycosyltransferase